MLAQFIGKRGR